MTLKLKKTGSAPDLVTRHLTVLFRCCMSPKRIIKEPVQRPKHGGLIVPVVGNEQATPDEHVNFNFVQIDLDAAELLPAPLTVRRIRSAPEERGDGADATGWASVTRGLVIDLFPTPAPDRARMVCGAKLVARAHVWRPPLAHRRADVCGGCRGVSSGRPPIIFQGIWCCLARGRTPETPPQPAQPHMIIWAPFAGR
jgi:hypothetical protein